MNEFLPDDEWLDEVTSEQTTAASRRRAPSRLKSRIYSELIRRQQSRAPLEILPATHASGRGLCVFENLVRISPVGEKAKQFNCCSVCHARVLGERVENAPIYWGNCPYVAFQNR